MSGAQKVKIHVGSGDWAQVEVGGSVVYRGHETECYEKVLSLLGVEFDYSDPDTISGPRVDDIEAAAAAIKDAAPDETWLNAMGLIQPSDPTLIDIGRVVHRSLLASRSRDREDLDPLMDVTLRFVAS